MELITSLALGIGLSACCGFRIFVPLLVTNIAALSGHYHFGQDFAWMGTMTAFYIFASATILEIIGYYIPWFDNLLDSIATPTSIIAGTISVRYYCHQISLHSHYGGFWQSYYCHYRKYTFNYLLYSKHFSSNSFRRRGYFISNVFG
jgi:hypothetical protein